MLFFRQATPIDVIEQIEIGSRPPSRRGSGSLRDLRAIPWGFGWIQSRLLLPAWFGVGSAFHEFASAGEQNLQLLRSMMRHFPFFFDMVRNVEMALAKADMGIAGRYARLAGEINAALLGRTVEVLFEAREKTGEGERWRGRLPGGSVCRTWRRS